MSQVTTEALSRPHDSLYSAARYASLLPEAHKQSESSLKGASVTQDQTEVRSELRIHDQVHRCPLSRTGKKEQLLGMQVGECALPRA